MAKLSFKRRALLSSIASAPRASAFDAFRLAFSDYSSGTKWMAKKFDALTKMESAGFIVRDGVNGKGETRWCITRKGMDALEAAP